MKKSFKLTHRPGQPTSQPMSLPRTAPAGEPDEAHSPTSSEYDTRDARARAHSVVPDLRSPRPGTEMLRARPQGRPTTRKTIEVPEEYFFRVKMHALQRRIKEKDMWAEILEEYFANHPDLE